MKLPVLTAAELGKVLERLGFQLKRQRGSHMFFEHPDGRTTVVPNHPGEELDRGLLLKIIKEDIRISREALFRILK